MKMPDTNDYYQTEDGRWIKKVQSGFQRLFSRDTETPSERSGRITRDYVAYFLGLVDIVDRDGDLLYLVKNGAEVELQGNVKLDGKTYVPPRREQLRYLIPEWREVEYAYSNDDAKTLFEDILRYTKKHYYCDNEGWHVLDTAWLFHTYDLDKCDYSGYLYLLGLPERGKTQAIKTLQYAAFRGIHVETLTEAQVIRLASNVKATLFFDVLDLWRKAQRNNCEDILLQRFERGATVLRVLYPDRGPFKDTKYFDIFGATVIATNEAIHEILETRSFPRIMPLAETVFPRPTQQEGLALRNRLVAWRAKQLGEPVPSVSDLALRRLNDISKPILSVIKRVVPEYEESFCQLVGELEKQKRESKADSREGQILKAVIDLQQEGKYAVSVKEVTDKVNQGRHPGFSLGHESVGRNLKKLGLPSERKHQGRFYYLDPDKLEQLRIDFGIPNSGSMLSAEPTQPTQPTRPRQEDQIQRDSCDSSDGFSESVARAKNPPPDIAEGDDRFLKVAEEEFPELPRKLYNDAGETVGQLYKQFGEPVYMIKDEMVEHPLLKSCVCYTTEAFEGLRTSNSERRRLAYEARKRFLA